MARALAALLAASCALRPGAADGAEQLTKDNFEGEVFGSGRNAFVKFLAPW